MVGPFFDLPLMKAVLVELAQLAAQAGNNFSAFFDADRDVAALETKLHRFEVTTLWAERYFGRKADLRAIASFKRMLAQIKGPSR